MISVVIPVRDDGEALARCLEALQRQSVSGFEVVVVDDGSTDGSLETARRFGAHVIRQERRGVASARNRGVREARGRIILFTDADCVPSEDWVERLAAVLQNNGISGAVGVCHSAQRHWVAALVQLELEERYARMSRRKEIDFLNTGNCAFRRDLLLEQQFDEGFRWLEDVELSFRLSVGGRKMVFVPEARVTHDHPESLWEYMKRRYRYALFAPAIYRRYPTKSVSDSRTPGSRRLQLILLALSIPMLFLSLKWSLAVFVGSLLLAGPLLARAFKSSAWLLGVTPVFVLAGNLAFLSGTLAGLLRPLRRKTR